jgi:hypothetical protein
MAPALQLRVNWQEAFAAPLRAVEVAWVNQATWRHCHFGPKPAPAQPRRGDPSRFRDFGPVKVGVI